MIRVIIRIFGTFETGHAKTNLVFDAMAPQKTNDFMREPVGDAQEWLDAISPDASRRTAGVHS